MGHILRGTGLNNFVRTTSFSLLDFFFPNFCAACKNKLSVTQTCICVECLSNIQIATPERIEREYERKFQNDNIISGFQSAFVFEKDKELQSILHSLKYNGKFLAGKTLGELASKQVYSILQSWNADFVVPVPLHPLKKAERGYNQSDFICKGLSKTINVPVKADILNRTRFTLSQTTMTLEERKENVLQAFVCKKRKIVEGKNIILVDDVITTGATTAECGKVLLEAGAAKVYAFSVAIAD
ncbi:MAG: ComF family protein [Melioribacteraceae bacterium]